MHHNMLERLESRTLLAGNVVVAVVGGDLVLKGDGEDNVVSIRVDPARPGRLVVEGDGETGTTVNGKLLPVRVDFDGDLRANLGKGDNAIEIEGVTVNGDLAVNAGSGSDRVRLVDTLVEGRLRIHTHDLEDRVDLAGSTINGSTRIDTSGGADLVTAEGCAFFGPFTLRTGAGGDSVFVEDNVFAAGRRIDGGPDEVMRQAIDLSFDFNRGAQGWRAGFTDYTAGQQKTINFKSGIRRLPGEIGEGQGYLVSGKNVSDDLFMYLTRQVGRPQGIEPNQVYQVRYTVRFASNAPSGMMGVGGSPGESVWLKMGASARRPATVRTEDYFGSNIDHGQQAGGGTAVSTAGHIANGIEEIDPPYVSLERTHVHTALIQADAKGRLHLIVGTESGFESTTALYYQQINVRLIPVQQAGQEKAPETNEPPVNPV